MLEPLGDRVAELLPEEAACVARAVDKRRREFAAGRVLARRLLAELGCPPGPLLPAPDRVPRWPEGIVGSLAHSTEHVVVAVARAGAGAGAGGGGLRALGVDLERRAPLDEELWGVVLRPEERRHVEALPAAERGEHALLVFCVKEAAYKAQYPLSGEVLEFAEVAAEVDPAAGRFTARLPDRVQAAVGAEVVAGVLHRGPTTVLAGVSLRG